MAGSCAYEHDCTDVPGGRTGGVVGDERTAGDTTDRAGSDRIAYHDSHDVDSSDERWECPHDAYRDADRCVFHLSDEERASREVDTTDVRGALLEALASPDRRSTEFIGATLPALDLPYQVLEGETRYPLDFRDATIGRLTFDVATVKRSIDLRDATVDTCSIREARFEGGLFATGATVQGEFDAFEATFEDDARFAGVTFEGATDFDEAIFDDDVVFQDAVFEGPVTFRGVRFHGRSNRLGDNTSFKGAVFEATARFTQAQFEYTDFTDARFDEGVVFEAASFDGDGWFNGCVFDGEADFDECRFFEDASFDGSRFSEDATFRGVEFEGGENVLEADASFECVTVDGDVDFPNARFGETTFCDATFRGDVTAREATIEGNATLADARFDGTVDFEAIVFEGDVDCADGHFAGDVVFRNATFAGSKRQQADNNRFDGAVFEGDLDFAGVSFTSVSFRDVAVGGRTTFTNCRFEEELHFEIRSLDGEAYIDMTGAVLSEGIIRQPPDQWVNYDLTLATLGGVLLRGEHGDYELLAHVRFCETKFDGFDFAAHLEQFERNNWQLHTFADDVFDVEYARELTPANIEVTYLNAKNAASATGNKRAAGEFRIKRQQFGRRKDLQMAFDDTGALSRVDRALKLSHAAENYFLGVTCGYGHRLARILTLFVLAPLPFGLLFTFGGPSFDVGGDAIRQLSSVDQLATPDGVQTLFLNTYFAYTSYTTVGYGDFSPTGILSRLFAITEAFVIVILSGLVIYTLIKRSEQ